MRARGMPVAQPHGGIWLPACILCVLCRNWWKYILLVLTGWFVSTAHFKEKFLKAEQRYFLSSETCPWSPWSEEIFSITKLFSVHQYSNMSWINTGWKLGSPVGVTLKGLTLWLPSQCEGLERLATFNIWTSVTPSHHAALSKTPSYAQALKHRTPACWYLTPTHIIAPKQNLKRRD